MSEDSPWRVFRCVWDVLSDHLWNAVGMIKLATARERRLAAVWATTTLKCCSMRSIPPKKKHMPMTRSKLESMEPMREVCTMMTSFLTRAMMATMSSTALPKEALRRPPIVSPVLCAC